MDAIPIGEAARRFGLRTSSLRYYESRGLLHPAARVRGTRMYGRAELRRLAFLQLAQKLGIPLDTAGAVLDKGGAEWRGAVTEQITAVEELIARAEGARSFLSHARMCPSEHPARECPYLLAALDRLVEGETVEQLAREHSDSG